MAFQVGSAFLDACVLAVLSREDTYGYVLTQRMRRVVDISESTLYPVLRRLQKGGFLSTYDSPYQGRNRRYYRITEEGAQQYLVYRKEWIWHKARVDELMFGVEEAHGDGGKSGKPPGRGETDSQAGQESPIASGSGPEPGPDAEADGEPESAGPDAESDEGKKYRGKETQYAEREGLSHE